MSSVARLSPMVRIPRNAADERHLIRPDGARGGKSRIPPINCFHYTFSPGMGRMWREQARLRAGLVAGGGFGVVEREGVLGARVINMTSIALENIHKCAML